MYIATIKQKFDYYCSIATRISYDVIIDGVKAFSGRLMHYDAIKLSQLDFSTLGRLDELDEKYEH